jgi:hypothetical protein
MLNEDGPIFLPAGYLNAYLVREGERHMTHFGPVYGDICCCGLRHISAAGDPKNGLGKWHSDNETGLVPISVMPRFGHLKPNCPGAGAPLASTGRYTFDGSLWAIN